MDADFGRRLVAEAIGTALLVLFGAGSVVAALNFGGGELDFAGLGMIALAFGLAGALAAVAAVAAAPQGPFAVGSGTLLGIKGLVAALVVGFASPWRAFAAGLVLGVVEAAIAGLRVAGLELGPEYREVLPLALALAWVATRRFGEVAEERVE